MVYKWKDSTRYAIGTDPDNLALLRNLHVPIPDQIVFSPAARYITRADGTRVGDGFPSVQWVWDIISNDALYRMLEYLDGADYARLYIRTDVRDATFPNVRSSFKVYYCIMWKPILSGSEGTTVARSLGAYQTVAIPFRRLEVQPSYI